MNGYRHNCSVDGCDRIHCGHGYCDMHLKRWTRTGTTDPRPVGAPLTPIVHGTYAGSEKCYRRAGDVCDACREARSAYQRMRRKDIRERREARLAEMREQLETQRSAA